MKILITILFLVLVNSYASSQFITELRYNQYTFKGETYKKQDLGFAFNDGTESKLIYEQAIKLRSQTKKALNVGYGCFVIGNLVIFSGDNLSQDRDRITLGVLLGYMLAPVIILVTIPYGIKARRKFHKALVIIDLNTMKYKATKKT